MQSSQLGPWSIILGKFWGVMMIAAALIMCVMPLIAVTAAVGGATAGDLVRSTVALLLLAAVLSGISIGASGLVRSVRNAVLLSYLFAFLMLVGPLVAIGAFGIIGVFDSAETIPGFLLYPEPLMLVADLVSGENRVGGPLSGASWAGRDALDGNAFQDFDDARPDMGLAPLWLRCLVVQGAIAGGMVLIASRRLAVPAEFER